MLTDFAIPLCGLMFTLPCLVAVHVLDGKKDRFEHLIQSGPGRHVLLGSQREVELGRMGLLTQRTVPARA